MMATADALQFLLKGDQIRLDRAKSAKLIDAIVPAADLVKAAKDWIKAGGKVEAAVGRGRLQAAGRSGLFQDGHDDLAGRQRDLPQARRSTTIRRRARSCHCVFEGLQVPFDSALRIESRYFAKIMRSPEAAAMIRSLFVSMQELNKGARRPETRRRRR